MTLQASTVTRNGCSGSRRRADVLVHMEEVRRIVDRTFVGALLIGGRTSCACISNARPRARAQAAGRFRGYDDIRVEFAAPSGACGS
jgi:hypothetical protein